MPFLYPLDTAFDELVVMGGTCVVVASPHILNAIEVIATINAEER